MAEPPLKNLPPRFRFTWPEWVAHVLAFISIIVALECLSVLTRVAAQGLEVDPEPYTCGVFTGVLAAVSSVMVQSRWVAHCTNSPTRARLFLLLVSILLLSVPLKTLAQNYRLLDTAPLDIQPYIVSLPAPLPWAENNAANPLPSPGALCRLWEARGLHPDGLVFDRQHFPTDYYFCANRPVITDHSYVYMYLGSTNARKLVGFVTIEAVGPDDAKSRKQITEVIEDLYAAAHAGTPPAALTKMLEEDNSPSPLDTPFGFIEIIRSKGQSLVFRLTSCGDAKCDAQQLPDSGVLPLPLPPDVPK